MALTDHNNGDEVVNGSNAKDAVAVYYIYQTEPEEDLTLPELADVLSLQALLRINGVEIHTRVAPDAEHISPSRCVPFIKTGSLLVSEYEPIITYLAGQGMEPSAELSDVERAEMKAYMSLIDNVLSNAERYLTHRRTCDDEEVDHDCSRHHAWPLSYVIPWLRRRSEIKRLQARSWYNKSLTQVFDDVETCCNALAEKLENKQFYFNRPTELEALVYGHIRAIMKHSASGSHLPEIVGKKKNLLQLCSRLENSFPNKPTN